MLQVVFLWLHDVIVECFGASSTSIYTGVAGIFALSEYHASMLPHSVRHKVVVTRNGLNAASFIDGPNHPHRFIYASDPARCVLVSTHPWVGTVQTSQRARKIDTFSTPSNPVRGICHPARDLLVAWT